MRIVDRQALIAAIDALHEGATEHYWHEAEDLALALGWPEGSSEWPDGTWIRAALDAALR